MNPIKFGIKSQTVNDRYTRGIWICFTAKE